jgi:hypothetical protein
MKKIQTPVIVLLLILMISCKKEESGLTPSDFRIKAVILYYNDQPQSKTIYNYKGDKLDYIENYENPFNKSYLNFNSKKLYEYNNEIVTEKNLTYVANQITSETDNEFEFNGGKLTRNNKELYSYENGLLVARELPENSKSVYEYENGKIIRISTYRYYKSTLEYRFSEKYEFSYENDEVNISQYYYQSAIEEWEWNRTYKYYYSRTLLTRKEYYYMNDTTVSNYSEYQYDNKENLISETSETSGTYYTNIYDAYNNLISVLITYSNSADTRLIEYYFEVGKTNIDELKAPDSPFTLFYNFKNDSNE